MRWPAEQRAQATAEWAVVLLAVGAVLTGAVVWSTTDRPRRIAAALEPPQTDAERARLAADAIAARPGALSMLGAQAWLEETEGPDEAQAAITAGVAVALRRDHRAWGADLHLVGPPLRGRQARSTVRTVGPLESRVVTFADERRHTAPPTLDDRASALATALGWQGASVIARRIARPLGLAVSAIQLAVGLADGETSLPPGARAGDVVVCRRATVATRSAVGRHTTHTAWRTGVLRDGRLILDAVATANPCRAPADD